jgi:hypothetical protein
VKLAIVSCHATDLSARMLAVASSQIPMTWLSIAGALSFVKVRSLKPAVRAQP